MAAKLTITASTQRSELMSRIRSKNTGPELAVRQMLHAMGLRFRLHRRDLAGKPDIVLPRHKLAIFVHGCFWHQHANCRLASKPKTRTEYWEPKLSGNVRRDEEARVSLASLGWGVEVIWECVIRDREQLAGRLQGISQSLVSKSLIKHNGGISFAAGDGVSLADADK